MLYIIHENDPLPCWLEGYIRGCHVSPLGMLLGKEVRSGEIQEGSGREGIRFSLPWPSESD